MLEWRGPVRSFGFRREEGGEGNEEGAVTRAQEEQSAESLRGSLANHVNVNVGRGLYQR